MEDEFREIAERIAGLRDACGYSIEELAAELDIPVEVYRKYEESGEDIPISVIYQISKKFGVDFTEILTGTSAKLNTYHVVRAGKGQVIDRYPGYYFKDLAYRYSKKIMQPLLVTIDPSDKPAALVTHKGEEFNMVLEGTIILDLNGKEIVLEKGDSVYFNPNIPHGQRCGGDAPATFLTMIAEI
ncbi:MAG: helix-turn-helix transcriptional regulator [Lachnospiraceae bacterium]|nr:helix-turn-helix transcriptional regulator [Lachnospiraceae bacterium]